MHICLTRRILPKMLIINEYPHTYRLTDCVTDRRVVRVVLLFTSFGYLRPSFRIALGIRYGAGLFIPDTEEWRTRSIVLVIAVADVL